MATPSTETSNNSNGISQSYAVDRALTFRAPTSIDSYAASALKETEEWIRTTKWEEYKGEYIKENPGSTLEATAKDTLAKKLSIDKIDQLTKKLDTNGLGDIPRLLLSSSSIYAFVLLQAVDSVKSDDIVGLANAVVLRIDNVPKQYFFARILANVTDDLNVQVVLNDPNKNWPRLVELTRKQGIDIRAGQVRSAVVALLNIVYKEGKVPYYVELYARSGTVEESSFTPAIKQSMIDYLLKLGVKFGSDDDFKNNDEYLALAYNEAQKMSAVADDPIDTARIKGGQVTWNFVVDNFDAVDRQGIIPENIKAAGALDYIYFIGEGMRVFDVANALVLRWASGMLDVPEGKTASILYRFHKLRNERSTSAERAMLYKRVLNRGNGKLLSSMVANTAFAGLWHQLMAEVVEYIRKSERSKDVWVSRAPLYQATKNLQYNLTEHMTGMSHVQVTEDYAHLQEALDIIRSEDIINHFGGRRKTLWSVIERVAKEDLGTTVPTAPLRTIAVEGNKIFQWIAGFESEGGVREVEFDMLLSAAESWIISQASMESARNDSEFHGNRNGNNGRSHKNSHRLAAAKPKKRASNDDFDDWDV
ncbi:hypothetical protein NIES2101_26270 [Calothrix sp. HK-06]|nr:hypothetical protein NIES2101_26270 [Calothrix sp. HK-06]